MTETLDPVTKTAVATTGADLVILAATVHTMDRPGVPPATAIAVNDGRILAVGDHADIRRLIGPRTEVLDAPGLVVTPGLVDSHQHPVLGLGQQRGVDLSAATDIASLQRLLAAESRRMASDEWLIGYGLDYEVFRAARPHRDLIDGATGGRPVWIWLADLHTVLLSTEAMRRANIAGPVDFADHAAVVADEHGVPTGELHEMSAIRLAHPVLPEASVAETARRLEDLFAAQNSFGLTGAHVLDFWPGTEELLTVLEDEGRLTSRLRVAPWVHPEDVAGSIAQAAELGERRRHLRTRWRAGAVKLFLDGTVDGGSAWLRAPDCHGESTRAQWLDPEQYTDAVHRAVRADLSCWTHAIGDAAVTHALDAYARAGRPATGRHRVEHLEVLHDADIARLVTLDVVASMQPTHMDWSQPDHSDNWSTRLGAVRCGQAWRYRDLIQAGVHVAFGSDWPIVDFDPRVVMAGARLRRPIDQPERPAYVPEQAIDARAALAAYTVAPARAAAEEAISGRIVAGFRADLTVFGADPLTCPAEDLRALPIAATVVDGEVVYQASA
ncbi:MAG: amidohydrolase [Solirubrobacteraceae bacterium]